VTCAGTYPPILRRFIWRPRRLKKKRIVLVPIHALVFATQCAHLPPLTCPAPRARGEAEVNTATLPVLPFPIPSPGTFSLLMQYLYTHQAKRILSVLIPVPSYTSSPQALSQKLTESCTVEALLSLLSTVYGLWRNVTNLGVFDEKLWQIIDFSWTVVRNALDTKEASGEGDDDEAVGESAEMRMMTSDP